MLLLARLGVTAVVAGFSDRMREEVQRAMDLQRFEEHLRPRSILHARWAVVFPEDQRFQRRQADGIVLLKSRTVIRVTVKTGDPRTAYSLARLL